MEIGTEETPYILEPNELPVPLETPAAPEEPTYESVPERAPAEPEKVPV
jgi:hypothetical protein